eukprot:259925-Prorocentrum_minimum.AAC.2
MPLMKWDQLQKKWVAIESEVEAGGGAGSDQVSTTRSRHGQRRIDRYEDLVDRCYELIDLSDLVDLRDLSDR